jgi:hypothetical protein
MNPDDVPKIEFHEEAIARFTELAQESLTKVRSFRRIQPPRHQNSGIHPVAHLTEKDVIGSITFQQRSVNGLGEETGRYWQSGDHQIGWEGQEFEAIKNLASKFENSGPLKGRVSKRFIRDVVFTWLRETLESKRTDTLCEFVAAGCSEQIKRREIWVPVFRTYSTHDFSIGEVQFRTISQSMLDRWYSRIPKEDHNHHPETDIALNTQRSTLQGVIAARINVDAEPLKAVETANAAADEAIALLRFLSSVNWTCRLVSRCLPIGKENTRTTMDIIVEKDDVQSIRKATIEEGPAGWSIDEARAMPLCTGVLEALNELASQRTKTEFRADLYGALQLHARHSVATEIAHKIVFVVAAAESIFLKDSSEPIQKNLGERMAFLIAHTVDDRRKVIKNVDLFYNIRSALIHHGRDVRDEQKDIIDEFFFNIWFSFVRLLAAVDKWPTRSDMFTTLENIKLGGNGIRA